MVVRAAACVAGIDSFTLLAIPLFLLAGLLMVHGGARPEDRQSLRGCRGTADGWSRHRDDCRLHDVRLALGIGVSRDVVAIGSMLLPAMKERGYDPVLGRRSSAAPVSGTVIPPSMS